MKHWIHGVHVLGPKSKWAKFRRHPNVYPPGGGATGGGGGGGVSAPPPSGGGGGGGGGGQAPPPPAPPSSPAGSTNIAGAYQPPQQQQLEPASYGVPNPEMPVSPGLQGALDGTGPGYAPQVQPNAQQPQWQAPGQPAPGQPQPGQQGQQQQVDPAWQALTQNLGRYGVPIPPNMTPEQGYMALAQAMQGAQQRNYYADLGRSLHETGEIEQFQAWRQQQQQAAAPQQQEESLWNVPHFDKQWLSAVEEDPATGRIRSKQGYDPRIGVQVQSYYDFLNNAQQEMWKDPQAFMWKFTEPMVQQAVQQAIQGSFGQYQEQVSAQAIINANSQWLYNRDPASGRTVHAQDGRPQLSPQGAAYFNHLDHASRVLGIQGSNQQHQYAVGMLERDLLRQRSQQAAAQQQPGLQAQNLRQQPAQQAQWNAWSQQQGPGGWGQQQQTPPGMGHHANVNGAQQMAGAFNAGQQQEPAMMGSLADMMRQGFAQENITDQQIAQDMRRTAGMGGFGPAAQPGQQPVWGQPQGQLPGW